MSKVTRLNGGQDGDANGQRLHQHEVPGERDNPPESVGQDLRAARLRRGDDLSRIAQALRIRKDYLEAIESDWPDRLPGRTYALGFIRSYAKYLELDAATLVSRYKLAIAGQVEAAPKVGPPPDSDARRLGFGWTVLALLVVGLLVYGVYQFSEPRSPNGETAAAATTPGAISGGAKGGGAKAASVHGATTRGLPGSSSTQTAASVVPAPAAAQPAAPPSGEVYGKQNVDARVILRARALAHILVLGPGDRIFINRLLHPGDVYRVPNLAGLSLSTPDAGALGVELDGRDMGPAGGSGQSTEAFSLDPQSIAGRKSDGRPGAE